MSHSRMVQTRRRKQVGKKILAREAKQIKKLTKKDAKPADAAQAARPE
jgi:hypothetical protein